MYWPFFRSKQEELLALRELGVSSLVDDRVVPIIKPHSSGNRVEGQLDKVLNTGLRIALVLNTDEGSPIPQPKDIVSMEVRLSRIYPGQIFPAFEVRNNTTSSDITSFISGYPGGNIVFIHREHNHNAALFAHLLAINIFDAKHLSANFVSQLSGYKVLLRDGFQRQTPNGNYPVSSNFASDLYSYIKQGFHGFGDYASIGDVKAAKGGGAASHVALHLTEVLANKNIICHHFVSSINSGTNPIHLLYDDAIKKLIQITGNPGTGFFTTEGVADYCANPAHYPGLGHPKRWSTKHHVEWVCNQLNHISAQAWV